MTVKLKSRKTESLSTAFHEAGHAVVAVVLCMPFKLLSIKPDKDFLGKLRHWSPCANPGIQSVKDINRHARNSIMVAFAGLPAERLFNPNANEAAALTDEENVLHISKEYGVLPRYFEYFGDEYHLRYLERLRKQAKKLVVEHSCKVELLAKELQRRIEMTQDEVLSFLDPFL